MTLTPWAGLKTLPDVKALPSPTSTSVSFVTPPPATLSLLQSTFDGPNPIAYAWLQPGAEDRAVVEWIREHKLDDRIVFGGPCVLVLGDQVREQAKL